MEPNNDSYLFPEPPITDLSFAQMVNSKGINPSRILNIDSSKDELTCACCLLIVWDPVCCASCESHFCNQCILQWIQRKKNNICPNCQCEFESHPIPRISKNLLSKLKINCIYEANGCKTLIDYSMLYTHEADCQYKLETCANKDCGLIMTLFDLAKHKDICPHLIVSCQHCKDLLKNCNKEAHEQECPYRKIQCCYELCGQSLMAKDYELHLEECGFKLEKCDFCNNTVIKKDLDIHKLNCDEKPVKCVGCSHEMKLRELPNHEENCELIEISCEICEKKYLRKDSKEHDRMSCIESSIKLLKSIMEPVNNNINNDIKKHVYKPLSQNNRIDILTKRLEVQANEISALKKELINLQMANLTDSKANIYTLKYPDPSHKLLLFPLSPKHKPVSSQQLIHPDVQNLKLSRTKCISLNLPENIEVKKHNYMSLCSLNENLIVIGDDIGRLSLYDINEEKELASSMISTSLEIKALALFAYDPAANFEELYAFSPKNSDLIEKSALSLMGYWLISGHGSGDIFIWDIEFTSPDKANFKHVSKMSPSVSNKISCVMDLQDQTHFITATYTKNNQIDIWDCLSDSKVCSLDRPHRDTISKLTLLEKKNRFVSASDDGTLRIWRIIRSPLSKIQSPQCEKTIVLTEPIWSLAVLPNNQLIVALNNLTLEIYDLESKEMVKRMEYDEEDGGLIGDLVIIGRDENISTNDSKGNKNGKEEIKEELEGSKSDLFILALHKDRIRVYDGELKEVLTTKQTSNEYKWGFLACHLMQILVARRIERKEDGGNMVKIAVLGQKGKKISVLELTVF